MTDDIVNRKTLSISEEIEEMESQLAETAQEAREAEEGSDRAYEIKVTYESLSQRLSAFERFQENCNGDEFVIKEMTFGEMMRAQDEVSRAHRETDGTPGEGYYKIMVMRYGIEEAPDGTPDPKDYPYHIGQWVYDEIDALNTGGEVEVGNLSLEEIAEE